MTKFLGTFAFSVAFVFTVVVAADYALSIPDVHVSYSTNECKGVTTYQGVFFDSLGYSCENMPTKFNHVWVK